MKRMTYKKIYFLLLLVILWGCSTKKNTSLSRGYHNLTAHYNVYFNGNESFKDGVKSIEEANEDDYTQVLMVFPESKTGSEQVASSQMDRAIEKGTKLIKKHSIRKKPKNKRDDQSVKYKKFLSQNEFNKWVDNAYLMIGKSQFYKHEYYQAQQSFAYMFREFQDGPEWCEAEIWNARSAIEQNDFTQAKILLEAYDIEGKAPSALFGFYAASYADFYLRQGKYEEAIPFLEEAVAGAWSKYYHRRLNFILAQVYQKQKQYAKASKAYEAVIKSNPPYEMAFNAKVNRAGVLFEEGGLVSVKKEIKKLLRDKRNIDYEDQIYYALAMAYKAEEQEDLAMDNFLLSIKKSTDNMHQKGMSFFELSEIYYDRPEYKPAYYNLDSAVINLNENYPGIEIIEERHKSLGNLVSNIEVVEREDSLIALMEMPEQARLALIDDIIAQEKKKQEEEKALLAQGNDAGLFYDPMMSQGMNQNSQGGKWYFYNQTSVGMGKLEFEKRWGRRKNEDNWRRINKEVVVEDVNDIGLPDAPFGDLPDSQDSTANEVLKDVADKQQASSPLSREAYLKDLPSSPEKLEQAHLKIQEGLLNQGLIYKDELANIPFAIKAFDELATRYPNSHYKEDALMNLYICYDKQDDASGMDRVKNQLVREFPDGEFTAFLNDPDYFEKREAREKEMEKLYQDTYGSYLFNEFNVPVANLDRAINIDEENPLIPKFKFIAGLSHAKVGDLSQFKSLLTDVKDNYSDSEVAPLAAEMLAQFESGRTPVKGPVNSNLVATRKEEFKKEQVELGNEDVLKDIASSYVIDHKSTHALILMVNEEADLNRLKFNIADYNFSKFLLNDYEMTSATLPDGTPLFAVKGFQNRLEALDYFYSIRERDDIFEVENLKQKQLYVIHDKNIEYLLSSGDKMGYDEFFNENYLSADAFKNLKEERIAAERAVIEAEKEAQEEILRKQAEEKKAAAEAQKPVVEEKVAEPIVEKKEPVTPVTNEPEQKEEVVTKELEAPTIPESQVETATKEEEPVVETAKEESAVVEEPVVEESIIEKPSVNFVKEEGEHIAVILFKKGKINTDRTGLIFKNYTKSNYGTKYQVESDKKGSDYFNITVKGFATAKEVQDYLNKVKLNSFLMREISRAKHYLWAITDNNLSRLTDEESFTAYDTFYKSNY
ncbi:type IX secretion system periplasmic lipoprotein PorW/SprE [Labilibacter marinus]|uniref:type IX secretion system periplasmic lipoprotein PorW/SprE n=1 Tax=Labilibacter marinus TaxID=1477105 RepID=UPI00117AE1CB|nr:tetratricopeptide repeat protein [Labilibacter marinus]